MVNTGHLREEFREQGFTIVRDVLDDSLLEEARNCFDCMLNNNPGVDPEQPAEFGDKQTLRQPFLARLSTDERLLEVASEIFGDSLVQLPSTYFVKTPGGDNGTLWHQDGAYRTNRLEPMKFFTIWIALDESTPENGCLRMHPGSHREGYLEHEFSGVIDSSDRNDDEIEIEDIDESKAVDIELEAGDISIHRPETLHAAYPNTSDDWRRAYAVRFTTTETRMLNVEKGRKEAFLLRGEPGDHQQYQPLPRYDPDDDSQMAFEGWQEYNRRAQRLNEKLSDEHLMDV